MKKYMIENVEVVEFKNGEYTVSIDKDEVFVMLESYTDIDKAKKNFNEDAELLEDNEKIYLDWVEGIATTMVVTEESERSHVNKVLEVFKQVIKGAK